MEEEGAFSEVWRFLKPQMGASRTSVLSLRLSVVSLCSNELRIYQINEIIQELKKYGLI
jgi:hypothetical protein